MKTNAIVIFFCMLLSMLGGYAQTAKPRPIPSFNIPVTGRTLFQESSHASNDNTLGKRRMQIQVTSQKTPDTTTCQATVWVYSLDHTTVLGPYTVLCGETLTVDIDDRDWGTLVESDVPVVVSVWITMFDAMK